MIHELKTWHEPFQAIASGKKRHEIRKTDRSFNIGDTLLLREWDPEAREYTGSHQVVEVTHITRGGEWGLPADICVMSIGTGRDGDPCAT